MTDDLKAALERIAVATPNSTNSATAANMSSWTRAVAQTALSALGGGEGEARSQREWQALMDGRDQYIVAKGLWIEFIGIVGSLPTRPDVAELVKRLRMCANGTGSFKTDRGDYGLCDEAADALSRLSRPAPSAVTVEEAPSEMIEVNGKVYKRFIRYPEPVKDGTARCIVCGQIDELSWHDEAWCAASLVQRAEVKS